MSKLRQLIRESITNYISEINEAGDISACESKILKTREAIELREKKISKEGIDEAYHDMLDENKLKEFAKEIKILEKSLAKHEKMLEKLKSKANKGEKVEDTEEKEIVDEVEMDVDLDENDPESGPQLEETYDEEMNESFLHMQKLAGVITEAQYKAKKKSLIENQLNEDNLEVKSIAKKLYSWLKQNGVEVKLIAQVPSAGVYGKKIGATGGGSTSLVWYWDDPKTKQTQIEIHLIGDPKIIADVEKKFLSAYPNLEQYQKTGEGGSHIAFRVKEKTTSKGGDINPNQRPNTPKPTV